MKRHINYRFCKSFSSFEMRNKQVFNTITDWWDVNGNMKTLHIFNSYRMKYITSFLKKYNQSIENKRLLDVGCGGGLLSESLSRQKGIVIGIDPNLTSITSAKEHLNVYKGKEYDEMISRIEYKNIKIEELSEEAFDFIFAFEVIEHINDQKGFIEEIGKRLKVGGVFFLSTINKTLFSRIVLEGIAEGIGIIPKGTHEYEKFIDPECLEGYLYENGIRIIDKKGVIYNPICENMVEIDSLIGNYIISAIKI